MVSLAEEKNHTNDSGYKLVLTGVLNRKSINFNYGFIFSPHLFPGSTIKLAKVHSVTGGIFHASVNTTVNWSKV